MKALLRPDLCVIGAGSGGLTVAAGAVQMGASVVLIEGGAMGGDCLNHGCVPSKALIAAARHAHAMTAGMPFGIAAVAPEIDHAAVMEHVARTIAAIAPHDSQERFESLGVTVLRDWACFTAPHRVETGTHAVEPRRFVIATGSRPVIPAIPGLDSVPFLTNETLFALRERPAHLIILGGGPVGIEMAQAHRRLGAEVTVIEAERALAGEDPEFAAFLLARLRAEGVAIHESTRAERVGLDPAGIVLETTAGTFSGSHLLVAAGRRPDFSRLAPEAGGIRTTARGIAVDQGLRSTTNARVLVVGDAAGGPQFTHLAGYHGGLVLRAALFGLPVRVRPDHVPRVIFTDPELAQVGLTEAEARARHGERVEILRSPYAENDRARTDDATEGRIKVVIHRGRPVGAGIVGAGAGELIGLWQLAIANRLRIGAIAGMIAPYPTLTEVSKRAAGQYYGPRLFANPRLKRIVRLVQRILP